MLYIFRGNQNSHRNGKAVGDRLKSFMALWRGRQLEHDGPRARQVNMAYAVVWDVYSLDFAILLD